MLFHADCCAAVQGYLGNTVNFGKVGPEFVDPEDDVILIIAPQSIIGASIHESLSAMAQAAGENHGMRMLAVSPRATLSILAVPD